MSTISKGYIWGSTELVTNVKLHTLVDSATISGILNTEITTAAATIATNASIVSTAGG